MKSCVCRVIVAVLCLMSASVWAQEDGFEGAPPNVVKDVEVEVEPEFDYFNHGFRLGYLHVVNHDCSSGGGETCDDFSESRGMQTPHLFLIGYELTQRLRGNSWLNVIFVENVSLGGLEQSLLLPSFNLLLGAEFAQQVQVAFGVNVLPIEKKPAHMNVAIGWTPRVGSFHTPLHFVFIPDVDGQHRVALTLGVNW